jgi:hypothetical protein
MEINTDLYQLEDLEKTNLQRQRGGSENILRRSVLQTLRQREMSYIYIYFGNELRPNSIQTWIYVKFWCICFLK